SRVPGILEIRTHPQYRPAKGPDSAQVRCVQHCTLRQRSPGAEYLQAAAQRHSEAGLLVIAGSNSQRKIRHRDDIQACPMKASEQMRAGAEWRTGAVPARVLKRRRRAAKRMEPMGGLEPPTSPLPRECSTAELHGL